MVPWAYQHDVWVGLMWNIKERPAKDDTDPWIGWWDDTEPLIGWWDGTNPWIDP